MKSIQDQSKKEDHIDIKQIIVHRERIFFHSHAYLKDRIEKISSLDHSPGKVSTLCCDLCSIPDNAIKDVIEAIYDSPKKKLGVNTWQYVFKQQEQDKKQCTGPG